MSDDDRLAVGECTSPQPQALGFITCALCADLAAIEAYEAKCRKAKELADVRTMQDMEYQEALHSDRSKVVGLEGGINCVSPTFLLKRMAVVG